MDEIIKKILEIKQNINGGLYPLNYHIDEFIDIEKSASDFLAKSVKMFNIFVENLNIDPDFSIVLDIELNSENDRLQGCPKTIEGLENLIDLYSVPEIIIDKKKFTQTGISEIEYYLCPLPFLISDQLVKCKVMYSEYRRHSEEDYYRWLTLVLEN